MSRWTIRTFNPALPPTPCFITRIAEFQTQIGVSIARRLALTHGRSPKESVPSLTGRTGEGATYACSNHARGGWGVEHRRGSRCANNHRHDLGTGDWRTGRSTARRNRQFEVTEPARHARCGPLRTWRLRLVGVAVRAVRDHYFALRISSADAQRGAGSDAGAAARSDARSGDGHRAGDGGGQLR